VRSGPGEARTILLLHIISVRPSKLPLMVRTFLKVYMELCSNFLFLQEQIKDIIKVWPSTHELTEQSKSWIYQTDRKVMLSKLVSSIIERDLECDSVLTLNDQKNMYTLPDYFSLKSDKIGDVQAKCQHEKIVNSHAWSTDIKQWKQTQSIADNVDNWIALRCTTKTISCNNELLPINDNNIDQSLLKPLIRKIRDGLLTPSYIDKS
jgi:hypothetical protein